MRIVHKLGFFIHHIGNRLQRIGSRLIWCGRKPVTEQDVHESERWDR